MTVVNVWIKDPHLKLAINYTSTALPSIEADSQWRYPKFESVSSSFVLACSGAECKTASWGSVCFSPRSPQPHLLPKLYFQHDITYARPPVVASLPKVYISFDDFAFGSPPHPHIQLVIRFSNNNNNTDPHFFGRFPMHYIVSGNSPILSLSLNVRLWRPYRL